MAGLVPTIELNGFRTPQHVYIKVGKACDPILQGYIYQPQFEHGKILLCVDAMGRATSIGANGWNPKHT
jgi:hypothetical protein